MCRGLSQTDPVQQLIHGLLFTLVTVVLVLDSAAFVLISLRFQTHIARVFIALCNATVHGSWACFAIFFLIQQSQKETVLRKLLDTIPARRAWGVLFCSAISFLAAAASLGLLPINHIDWFLSVSSQLI